MKKKVISVVLLFVLCIAMTIPVFATSITAQTHYVSDHADLLTPEEEHDLYIQLEQLSQKYSAHIFIATVNSIGNMDISDYIELYYDQNEFGYGPNNDGILLLVCMDIREFRILTNGSAQDAIGGYEIDSISDAIVSDMSGGDYYAAFDEFINQCDYYLDGHINGFPFDWGQNLLIAVVIGLAAGLITAFVLKAQLKSVRKQYRADAYVKSGSMQLSHRSDLYLYRNVTRVRKESSSSSGSRSRSGSSRSVGGRSF